MVDMGCGRINPEELRVGPLLDAGPLGVGIEFVVAEPLDSDATCCELACLVCRGATGTRLGSSDLGPLGAS